jgi:hypothetical protein
MTVESTARKQSFAGGQQALTFSFRALVDSPEDIKVVVVTSGTETLLTYGTQYTVTVSTDGIGGVAYVVPSYSTAYTYTVYRETTNKQESDYDDYNKFPADTLEEDLDRRTLVDQEQSEDLDRVIKVPISSSLTGLELPAPSASTVIGWNAAADGLANYDNAATSVTAATTQATLAGLYASTASTQALTASTQASLAGLYATTASTAATLAGNYATTASTAAGQVGRTLILKVIEDSDSVNTGDGQIYVTIPTTLNNHNLSAVGAHVYTASTSGVINIQIRNVTDSQNMLSTPIYIDQMENDSSTAATASTINTSYDDVVTADVLAVDVDGAGSQTKGLEVRLSFTAQ